jgi:hypothetical protein
MAEVHAHKRWGRWGGSRADIVRMADMAARSIEQHTGVGPKIALEVSEKSGVTETGGLEVLSDLHENDLGTIESVDLTVDIDYETWSEARNAGSAEGPIPRDRVRVKIDKWGTSLHVHGDDRDQVRGLRDRMAHEIGHGAGNRWAQLAFVLAVGIVVNGATFGIQAGLGRHLSQGESIGVAALAVACVVGANLLAFFWLFPGIDIRPDGRPSRWDRTKRLVYAALGSLVLAVVGSFIYGAIPHR